jgi:hypothetical protein
MIASSPLARTVYSSRSELTVPSTVPARSPPLQAHPVADAKRLRAGEHGPGDHVAERLLRSEADQDGCERTADGEFLRTEAGEAQGDHSHDEHRPQADEEADGARSCGLEVLGEHRAQGTPTSRASCQPSPMNATASRIRMTASQPRGKRRSRYT